MATVWPSIRYDGVLLSGPKSDGLTGQLLVTDANKALSFKSLSALDTGLTQGSVPFIEADGSLGENNANLFWDDGATSLGIGTGSPDGSLLHLRGPSGSFATANLDGADNTVGVTFNLSQGGTPRWDFGITADPHFKIRDKSLFANPVIIEQGGGADQLRLTANSRIGMGLASPSGKLHIRGSADEIQHLIQANGSQTKHLLEARADGGATLSHIAAGGDLVAHPDANRAGAFRVEQADGADVLNVDTTNIPSITWSNPADGLSSTLSHTTLDTLYNTGAGGQNHLFAINGANKLRIQAGEMVPAGSETGAYDLGSTSAFFRNGYFGGLSIDPVATDASATGKLFIKSDGGSIMIDTEATQGNTFQVDSEGRTHHLSDYYKNEVDNGTSTTSATINWPIGNKQSVTLGGDTDFSFTDPPGPADLVLKLVQDGPGNRTPTLPVQWPGGTAPSWSTTDGAVDVVFIYFDGTNYYAKAELDYS